MANAEEFKEVMQAVSDLRQEVETKSKDFSKIVKIETFLDEQEKKNQEFLAQKNLIENLKKDLEEKNGATDEEIKSLEKQIARLTSGSAGNTAATETDEQKSFKGFIQNGMENLTQEERKYLRTNDDTNGGYLVPTEYVREIIKNITEVTPFRNFARIRQTTAKEIEIPKRTAIPTASWVGEGETDALSNSNYGLEVIPVHKMQFTVQVTHEQLRDAAFSMESEIFEDVRLAFAVAEGSAFVSGNAVKKPQGFLLNAGVSSFASGNATAITADSVIEIQGQVKTGYNLSYGLNRKTLAKLRLLKTGDGQYLWAPGLGQGAPNTLAGLPYVEMPDMPDIAAGTKPIAIGDWRAAYTIVDNLNMESIRDDYTKKREGKVEFTFFKRTGGQVVLAEAIKLLEIAA